MSCLVIIYFTIYFSDWDESFWIYKHLPESFCMPKTGPYIKSSQILPMLSNTFLMYGITMVTAGCLSSILLSCILSNN